MRTRSSGSRPNSDRVRVENPFLKERAAVRNKYQRKERKSNHKFEVVGGQELMVRVPLSRHPLHRADPPIVAHIALATDCCWLLRTAGSRCFSRSRSLPQHSPPLADSSAWTVRPPGVPAPLAAAFRLQPLRWTATGLLEAERKFRRIKGYQEIL